MVDLIFDDIGSYPLPEGITREWVESTFSNEGSSTESRDELFSIIDSAFQQKLDAGVMVPTYPQFRGMDRQFMSIINDPDCAEEPFKVREDCARIGELEAIEAAAARYREEHGEKPDVRVCVTGPLELYLKDFGGTEYTDILNALAVSVDRFVSNSIRSAKNFNIRTISIDEPSIGINPQIMFEDHELVDALTLCTSTAAKRHTDVEIHLHSPLHYNLACDTPNINVIGVESAASPSYLDLIDKKVLEDSDSFLRVGVARTDIFNLVAVLNEKYNTNVWKEPHVMHEIVTDMETPEIVEKRLDKAYSIFGDLIKYAGPDCGLGSWPTQQMAGQLLSNVAEGIARFRK
ncbi:MAG: methionine synthase [Methanosarcinaceae archaeon]|nr:methionine synthase [Methanosarcinaceae archaeon]